MQQYNVTRKFTAGTLAGMKYAVGFECRKPVGGSPYMIVAVEVL